MLNIILAPCQHGYAKGDISQCPTCGGSGYVTVIPSEDGPKECKHGFSKGDISECSACSGSGWAGLVNIYKLFKC